MGTITLAPTPLPGAGYLLIDKALTIDGPGARSLAVSGNDASTVFIILPGVAVTIAGLTITRGNGYTGSGGGIVKRRHADPHPLHGHRQSSE